MASTLQSLFTALQTSAQVTDSVSTYYVARSSEPSKDPIANIKQQIAWSGNGSFLFSGLRGSGKTTELLRLIEELQQEGCAAFYCDASRYLNLNDPQLTLVELVLTSLAGLADAANQKLGARLLGDSIWDRTKRLLKSEVTLHSKVKVGSDGLGAEVDISLADNPEFKKQLLDFARQSNDFFAEAQQFASDLVNQIKQRTGKSTVLLAIDSLERLSSPSGEEHRLFDSLKDVFFNNPNALHFPGLSVIYTAPPYLEAVINNVAGGFSASFSLPNFKVLERSPHQADDYPRHTVGINQMVEIINRRVPDWESLVSRAVLEHLAWMSGGNVRRYFDMVRTVCMKAAISQTPLPIEQADSMPVREAITKAAEPLQWLTAQDRKWLEHFQSASNNPSEHIENLAEDLPSIIRLFDHSLVLNYQNGSVWYQVPPLVRQHVYTR